MRPSVRAGKAFLSDCSHLHTGEDPDVGEDWGPEEKETTEGETAGWHHRLNGLELAQTPGDAEGQGGLACCHPPGRKESDTTERLNNTVLLRVKHPQSSVKVSPLRSNGSSDTLWYMSQSDSPARRKQNSRNVASHRPPVTTPPSLGVLFPVRRGPAGPSRAEKREVRGLWGQASLLRTPAQTVSSRQDGGHSPASGQRWPERGKTPSASWLFFLNSPTLLCGQWHSLSYFLLLQWHSKNSLSWYKLELMKCGAFALGCVTGRFVISSVWDKHTFEVTRLSSFIKDVTTTLTPTNLIFLECCYVCSLVEFRYIYNYSFHLSTMAFG